MGEFEPMQGFDWDQFFNGVWYVTQKFATRSTCLTYEFTTDELGFKEITQLRQLPYSEKVGLDHEYKYTGKLYAANEAQPAKMNVRFPLNPIGAASFVVLDTDYTSYGLSAPARRSTSSSPRAIVGPARCFRGLSRRTRRSRASLRRCWTRRCRTAATTLTQSNRRVASTEERRLGRSILRR